MKQTQIVFSLATVGALLYGFSRVFSQSLGDFSAPAMEAIGPTRHIVQAEWKELAEAFTRDDRPRNAKELFLLWVSRKLEAGWKRDISTSIPNRTHRYLVTWDELPLEEQIRWELVFLNASYLVHSRVGPGAISEPEEEALPDIVEPMEEEEVPAPAKKPVAKKATKKRK